ncbi:MAG TPA: deoxyribodipyrimidine photo-lyase, partial [bacterium]|nr:deoxyribodipyrimidine photo-lyase [bacterium]
LYWMQASQRAEGNHALEYAIRRANELQRPLIVGFGLTSAFPEGNCRHYTFMLEGLQLMAKGLQKRGIPLVVRIGSPPKVALELAQRASLVVTDRGYLRIERAWRDEFAQYVPCHAVQIESNVVVPIALASSKQEIGARTLRPKIKRVLFDHLIPIKKEGLKHRSIHLQIDSEPMARVEMLLAKLGLDASVKPSSSIHGGTDRARILLRKFIKTKLRLYAESRSDPSLGIVSNMSPYLHFGQISPIEIALTIIDADGVPSSAKDAYLEELIVRRELAINYCFFNSQYDQYEGLPAWAQRTLSEHAADPRPYRYRPEQLEQAQTHDPYWNASQREMLITGTMHNYMRMYWGKKILEWTKRPQDAFALALYLNNKYQLDGRDPNSFAGVGWCFGTHDRAWPERPIFGKIRYMNDAGLKRKFNIDDYVRQISHLE